MKLNQSQLLTSLACVFFVYLSNAQRDKGRYIDISLGYGITAPYDDTESFGDGLYLQADYVFAIKKWFQVRPYAGLILTSQQEDDNRVVDEKVTSNGVLLGGKVRLAAPIPYVAPYIETGLGASIGSFFTKTASTNIEAKGFFVHVPATLGLALGKRNSVDVEFTYYFQPRLKQFVGAAAVGLTIQLGNN